VAGLEEAGFLRRAGRPSDRRGSSCPSRRRAPLRGRRSGGAERALHEWLATALGARDVAAIAICHAVDEDDIVISEIAERLAAAHRLGE
jgi:hypothetical protein